MNIGGVSAIAFVLIRYFVRQRELAMNALGKAHRKVSRERERLAKIKSVLARFVPVTAKNMIEKDPGAILEKYIEDATVLFLDIEGFTTLVHQYSHDRINQVIESYFSTFFDVIQKYGGDVNETAGDGMMVIFLNPNAYKHPANAVRAALAIGKTCDDYRSLGDSDLFPIRVNIGISSGEVFLGSTKMRGSEGDRWTFTASGPVTILAARLSQYGRNGQILLGEETARRIRDSFDLIPLGKVELKNIADPGQVFQVVAASL
jgi:class 3 adenylate cyclase